MEKTGVTEIVPPVLGADGLTAAEAGLAPDDPLRAILQAVQARRAVRFMPAASWIAEHASGTLRKNKKLGFAWLDQYLTERVAYEFGWGFECRPASRVMWGRPYTEGDCHAITEAGWHIERYLTLKPFPEDSFEAKYLQVEHSDGTVREGIGIVVRQTSAAWIGQGRLVYAIVAEFNRKDGTWLEPTNPF